MARERKKAGEQQKQPAAQVGSKPAAKAKGGAAGGGTGGAGASGAGAAGGGRTAGGGAAQNRPPPAKHNGLSVCFPFNTPAGCARTKQGQNSCADSVNPAILYSHACNWYTRPAAGQPGSYCLAAHPRFNH